jgi:hypothetical protein
VNQSRRLITYLFAAAIVVAPFVALLYDITLGLAVLVVALGLTAYVVLDVAQGVEPELRQRLTLVAYLNAALAVGAAGLLLARIGGWI